MSDARQAGRPDVRDLRTSELIAGMIAHAVEWYAFEAGRSSVDAAEASGTHAKACEEELDRRAEEEKRIEREPFRALGGLLSAAREIFRWMV